MSTALIVSDRGSVPYPPDVTAAMIRVESGEILMTEPFEMIQKSGEVRLSVESSAQRAPQKFPSGVAG